MNAPAITVLMPLYNGAPHLPATVASVLAQSFADFELLIVDDGSTDGGPAFVRGLADPRLLLVGQPENRGIVATLNHGLALARGRYIARMDADDLMMPDRLARQHAFLEAHPAVGVCGSFIRLFGGTSGDGWVRFTDDASLKVALLFENPFCHPAVMLRREVLAGLPQPYPGDAPHAEEYALWTRLALLTQFANLPDVLLDYRVHARQVSRVHSAIQCRSIEAIQRRQLAALGLVAVTPAELALHQTLGTGFYPLRGYRAALGAWTRRLREANARTQHLPAGELHRQLATREDAAVARTEATLAGLGRLRRWRWQAATWWRHRSAVPRP